MQPTLPISRIVPGDNPREHFDPDEMAELEGGIREFGVIEPIIVRPVPNGDHFAIVAGERRWRAAKKVFGDAYDMPVVIKEVSDGDSHAMAVIENHHRANPSVAEEAKAAQRQMFRNRGDKDDTARMLGWSPDTLERRLALLACTPAVLKALTLRQIQLGHAEPLAGVPSEKQDSVLTGLLAHKVTVAALKAQLGRFARRLADAIFDTTPCGGCQHNSARQSGLFGESLGEGYCQHPAHFEELTMRSVEAKAATLRDQYPVVKIVQLTDGFTPMPVAAGGELGVGEGQYTSCQGCQSFGCAVSAMPGTRGDVTHSLCFDAGCNSEKVAAWRRVGREADRNPPPTATTSLAQRGKHEPSKARAVPTKRATALSPSSQTPQRVVDHRIAQWRKWAARALMTQPERSHRVLIALALAGRGSDLRGAPFEKVLSKIAGSGSRPPADLGGHLRRADAIGVDQLPMLVQAVAASAALGIDTRNLELLLNYLGVDEARCFQLDKTFFDLFTMSELESLAGEVGLKKAMGAGFKTARMGRKADFIAALLTVDGFGYRGCVPGVMRYPRTAVADLETENEQASTGPEVNGLEKAHTVIADEALALDR